MRGKFITFEGIDGSGKSTQLRLLAGELRLQGYNVLATMEPGGTPLGRRLRAAFLETEETVAPLAELLLFAADRAQHVEFLVKPALEEGKIVVSDRYADATVAYPSLLYLKTILDTISAYITLFRLYVSRVCILYNLRFFSKYEYRTLRCTSHR
ncbi:MAG TPA: dTMP kinase [Pyrinomonadaceae bacterium]